MRNLFFSTTLLLVLASTASAQFITDVRPEGRRPGRRLTPIRIDLHQVEAAVTDGVATTTIRQVFRNPNRMVLEGTYFFPIPENAAVGDFAMSMGGKMVEGEVLEKGKAAAIYEGIVRRQKDPGLLEYMGRRLFRARVFPIPAGGTLEIRLSYTETLHRDGRSFEYRYPFRTKSVSNQPVEKASLKLTIKSAEPIRTVYSPSHTVDVSKKGDHEAVVGFEQSQDPGDRDFVLAYGLSKDAVGASLFTHEERGGEGAFLLLLAPGDRVGQSELVAKDVLFVIDTSGSMAGEKIEQTRRSLQYCLKSLNPEDRFNLIPFATEANPLNDGLVAATKENVADALKFVAGMKARGGTNINDALVSALGMSHEKERPLMVIFMTDGEPTIGVTANERITGNVKEANKALTRLFVFGVGEDVRAELLDQLAEENHGTRDYVGAKEDIEAKISSFFEKVSSPVLSDVAVSFEGVKVRDTYPKDLPDLFRGSQLLVTGRYEGEGTGVIRLKGKVNGKEKEFVFEKKFAAGGEGTAFVPRLWAVRKVGFLLDQVRLNGETKEIKDEVVRLGKTYGIVTPYTSYLVVEDEATVARAPRRRDRDAGRGGWGRDRARGDVPGHAGPAGGGTHGPPATGARGGGGVAPRPTAPGTPRPEADPAQGLGSDGYIRGLAERRKARAAASEKEEPAGKKAGDKPAKLAPGERAADAEADDLLDELKLAEEQSEEAEKLRRAYFESSIELSRHVKALREARSEGGQIGGTIIRRVANRTFYHRFGLYVEAPILDLDGKVIEKRLVRIEAFSPEYFALLKANSGLAGVLALGDSLLFQDGVRIVQIVPAGTIPTEEGK